MYQYRTSGVCAKNIEFDIVDNKVVNVKFYGGCNGNLQGISKLIEGMEVEEVIKRLSGLSCGFKSTSCPDQLAKALKVAIEKAVS
ncbi:MAG: TIGR03905 family TSCPD domain-containing protein [Tissierellia bacterium]|nr:TIGR03905 family TSCPD domain-containing protein [Tissierellia bacterium]